MSAAPIPQGVERFDIDPGRDGFMDRSADGEYVLYADHAAALAASEARVKQLEDAVVIGIESTAEAMDLAERLHTAEQSLAEARKLLLSSVVAVHAAARDCRAANLPTAASQYDALARAIDAMLKGDKP